MKLRFKKGLDLKLVGGITSDNLIKFEPDECAIVPDDFNGFIPKLMVREGDPVLVGSPLLHDKISENLCLVSPVSGTVKSIIRGERRKILRVVITNDHRYEAVKFDTSIPVLDLLALSGLLAMMRRRPYDVVVRTAVRPADIFVTALDTAPLAYPLVAQLPEDASEAIRSAVKALSGMFRWATTGRWATSREPRCTRLVARIPQVMWVFRYRLSHLPPPDARCGHSTLSHYII